MAKRNSARDKIPVSGASTGLQSPFSQLAVPGLIEGEAAGATSAPTPDAPPTPAEKRGAVLRRETAHRGGKTVVIVGDIVPSVSPVELEMLASDLRKACGCGGTVRGQEIEIQGEQVARVRALLEGRGFLVRGVR